MAMNDNQDKRGVEKAISPLFSCEEYQPSEDKCDDKCPGKGKSIGARVQLDLAPFKVRQGRGALR